MTNEEMAVLLKQHPTCWRPDCDQPSVHIIRSCLGSSGLCREHWARLQELLREMRRP